MTVIRRDDVARGASHSSSRMAIGATPSRVRIAVLRQSLTLTGIGAVIGLLAAAAITRYLESMLFELAPWIHRRRRAVYARGIARLLRAGRTVRVESIRLSRLGMMRYPDKDGSLSRARP
jgi:ABC-type antimicrobial peptide transport system permease subunit